MLRFVFHNWLGKSSRWNENESFILDVDVVVAAVVVAVVTS
jgi:hypothetical protein